MELSFHSKYTKLGVTYLEETQDVGDHDGHHAERSPNDRSDGLMRYVQRWNPRWAFVFRHILEWNDVLLMREITIQIDLAVDRAQQKTVLIRI